MDEQPVSFDDVFVANCALIVRYAERRLPSRWLAEDVAGETFTAAWARHCAGKPVELPWLYRVAANKVADHYRSTSRQASIESSLTRAAGETPAGLDVLDRIALQRALVKLAPRDREVIMLTYWEGLSASEVSMVVGVSVIAVWASLSRTRRKLRAMLDDTAAITRPAQGGGDE